MLELYHHGSSVCAAKVRLALAEKGVEWRGHYVDILAGEQHDAAFLALNPRAAVPVLVHDGRVILESSVICEYVDQAFDGPPLRPDDAYGQAQMRLWTKRVDEEIHPATRPLTYVVTHRHAIIARGAEEVEAHIAADPHPGWRLRKRRWIFEGFAAPDVTEAVGAFHRLLLDMEAALTNREWLAGDAWTLADGALVPYVNRLEMLGLAAMWQDLPNVTRWIATVRARPSFVPALEDWLPAELGERMRGDGRQAWPELEKVLAGLAEG